MNRMPTPCPPLRASTGFTLVELLVVVTLIGVAGALSLPKINRITNENKVQRAAQALRMEVQQAFAVAGRNRAPVRLRWVSSSMQLQLTNLAQSIVYRRIGLGTDGGYGLSSSEITVSRTILTVFPNGLADDTLKFTLTRQGFTRTVRASKSGMVRVQ
jgi:prepilin-type N-terminal cleavage/methylation domain-containing protein